MDLWRAFRDRKLPPPIDDEAWAPYAQMLSEMPTPPRPRDFTLSAQDAERLTRRTVGWQWRLAPVLAPAMAMAIIAVAVSPAMFGAPGSTPATLERNSIETSGGGVPAPALDAPTPFMLIPVADDVTAPGAGKSVELCPTPEPTASMAPTPSPSQALEATVEPSACP